jgi:hypothetical protein
MFLQTKSIWADKSVSDLENGKYSVASTSTSPSLIRDGLSLGVVLR